jgi:hypothetical protein
MGNNNQEKIMTTVEMEKEIEMLREQNAILKAKAEAGKRSGVLTLRVSAKGAISIYGLSAKFPTTLYASQWQRLLQKKEDILAFIEANKGQLSSKEDKEKAA